MMYYKVFIIIFLCFLYAQNSHPIILIHGFLGWGRDEMSQYYYWGGKQDYEQKLNELGYTVYTVSLGPISTNWERAIEAFYQIKGGQVDYGSERSNHLGILQRPKNKNYNGFFPSWNKNNPIHIIAHSQGGQTARMLELILSTVYPQEQSSVLSNNYDNWIKSITTISTPHNGSTLVPIMLDIFPFTLGLAPWLASINNNTIDRFYSFDLEQWNLKKKPSESVNNFLSRIKTSSLSNPKKSCSWELSPNGAKEFNKNYNENPDIYYFSFSTFATINKENSLYHVPDSTMSIHLWPTSMLMGKYDNVINESWYENDGVVNSYSMSHPFGSKFSNYSGTPITGKWQLMQKLNVDHQAIIGHSITENKNNDIFVIYKDHCKLLYSLK